MVMLVLEAINSLNVVAPRTGAYLTATFTKPTDDAGGLARYTIQIAQDPAFTTTPPDKTAKVCHPIQAASHLGRCGLYSPT